MSEVNNTEDLNEQVEQEIDDATVITVPIDTTLANSGEAADAKAVGDALALKADKSELLDTIKVNEQSADNQGQIYIDATDIPMSGTDSTTIKAAVEAAAGRTANDIPMSSSDATKIKAAIEAVNAKTGADIAVSGTDSTTLAAKVTVLDGKTADDILASDAEGEERSIADVLETLEDQTANELPMSSTDPTTVKAAVEAIDAKTGSDIPVSNATGAGTIAASVAALEARTAADIPMSGTDSTKVKAAIEDLDAEAVKSVNGELPGATGNVEIKKVDLAENLSTDKTTQSDAEFIIRTSGGSASIENGDAFAMRIMGNRVHEGRVYEELEMTVTPMTREEGDPITATIDRDTFVAYVDESSTITITYTTEWSADPTDYGITVTGTPVAGDQITVVYVKEDMGTIYVAEPDAFVSTGWNLYDFNVGYARVCKYSETYGFRIGGTYSSLAWAETLNGARTVINPVNGLFTVPGDGFVFVTGGNSTDTYVLNTWSDWTEGPDGDFEEYSESTISLTSVMTARFPNGLLRVGDVRDEINLNTKTAISRIGRMSNTAENLASAEASGREYEYDTEYIYIVKETADVYTITESGDYTANDHGNELFTGTSVPVYLETLYGENLKNKLERDVVTFSNSFFATKMPMSTTDGTKVSAAIKKALPGTAISQNANLNNLTEPGHYFASGGSIASTVTNKPPAYSSSNRSFGLDVARVGSSNRIMQTYHDYAENRSFIRHLLDSDVQDSWVEIVTDNIILDSYHIDASESTSSKAIYYRGTALKNTTEGKYLVLLITGTGIFCAWSFRAKGGTVNTVIEGTDVYTCSLSSGNNYVIKASSQLSYDVKVIRIG